MFPRNKFATRFLANVLSFLMATSNVMVMSNVFYAKNAHAAGSIASTTTTLALLGGVPVTGTITLSQAAAAGGTATDSASVTGHGPFIPTGSVSFYSCYSVSPIVSCGATSFISAGTLSGSLPPTANAQSGTIPVAVAGYYCFYASFPGDNNYAASADTDSSSTSPGTTECFQVIPDTANTTTTTTMLANAGPLALGASDSDQATISGATPTAGGTVTYTVYYNNLCQDPASTGPSGQISAQPPSVTVSSGGVPPSASVTFNVAGNFFWQAQYSGDSNNAGSKSACTSEEVAVNPDTTTTATTLTKLGPIAIGSSDSDSATITNATATAGGTVTYTVYSDSLCMTPATTGVGNQINAQPGAVTVNNDVVPNSALVTFNDAGTYYWQAFYSGDSNNTSSISACTSEEVVVNPNTTTTETELANYTIAIGSSDSDQAIIMGATATAGGTVTYTVYSDSACSVPATTQISAQPAPVTVTNGVAPASASVTFNDVGIFYWQAVYSGDSNNGSSTSPCQSETLEVDSNTSANPTITTMLSTIYPIGIGTSVNDTATISGATPTAGGTLTYSVYSDLGCQIPATAGVQISAQPAPVTVTNGVAPASASVTFNEAGTYYWQAVYSGDSNNNPAISQCKREITTVSSTITNRTTTTTTLTTPGSITIGASDSDNATITGATPTAGGTVTYLVFTDSACMLLASTGATGQINAQPGGFPVTNGTAPTSASVTFNEPGTYYWQAQYSGDASNTGSNSPCTSEELVVNKANTPTISTTQQPTSAMVGSSIADQATVSGGDNPTGTVTFNLYDNATATGTPLFTDANEPLSGGTATSAGYTATATGTDYWVATYNGDGNNNSVTSDPAGEPVTISSAALGSPTITTSATSDTVGGTISDTATISGLVNPTGAGTISFTLYPNSGCTGTPTAGPFTSASVTGNGAYSTSAVPTATAGTYYWSVSFSGDANNSAIAAVCNGPVTESSTVGLAISTTSTQTSIPVPVITLGFDGTATDTATVTGVTGGPAPTGPVTFYSCFSATASPTNCGSIANPGTLVGNATNDPVQLGNAIGDTASATSPVLNIDAVGYYCFYASYGGDSNYSGSADTNTATECFQVTPVVVLGSPTISTKPSAGGTVGVTLNDSARVTGGNSPTGSVTFNLFAPSDSTCSSKPVYSESDALSLGMSSTVTGYVSLVAGTYHWTATYNGDAQNNPATSACASEPVVVTAPTGTGSLKILKTLSNPNGATTPAHFTIDYSCTGGSAPVSGSVSVAAGSSKTVTGIPAGSSCTIMEPTLATISGYTWATPVITGSPALITKGGTASVTVANSITQNTGSLKISKTLSNPNSAPVPTHFTIDYACGSGHNGSVSVAAGSSQTVSGIPAGSSCTITEPTLATISGYTWATPVITGSPASITTGGTASVTVANAITQNVTGSLKISKTLSNPNSAPVPTHFTIDYACGSGHNGSVSVAAGGSQTVSGIPAGSSCTVTEPTLATISGYTWATPVITGSPALITKGGTASVTVANSITQNTGSLKISKTLSNPNSCSTVPTHFTIDYNCGAGYTGSVSVAAGSSQTVSGIPAGSKCTITEPTLPTISGYTWATPVITGSPASITAGGTANVSVANAITKNAVKTGSLKISKTLSNPDSCWTTPDHFTIDYNCGAGYAGSVSVTAGSSQTVSGIPAGSKCTITEPSLPGISGFTWATPVISGSPASITAGGTASVTVTNSIKKNKTRW